MTKGGDEGGNQGDLIFGTGVDMSNLKQRLGDARESQQKISALLIEGKEQMDKAIVPFKDGAEQG